MIAVIYDYEPSKNDLRLEKLDEHRGLLRQLLAKDYLIAASAWADGTGALLLFKEEDPEACLQSLDADPYLALGVIAARHAHVWNPGIGSIK